MPEIAAADADAGALGGRAARFGTSLEDALSSGRSSGRAFAAALSRLVATFGHEPGPVSSVQPPSSASAAIEAGARVRPFASGGVVSAPTYFPLGSDLGLAGERGQEAILPLARGSDGKLGVGGSSGSITHVTVNVATTDAANFRRSEAQVSAALARAVARGRRAS